MTVHADLFQAWLRIGLFGFGGGPSAIPLIRAECVDRYHWMTDAEFLDALAFGNALPGPIAVKLAAYVGSEAGGWAGATVAVLALCLPSIGLMVGVGALWHRYHAAQVVEGMMRAARPVVVGMLAWTAFSLAPEGVRSATGGVLAALTFVALWFEVHPALIIVIALAFGAAFLR